MGAILNILNVIASPVRGLLAGGVLVNMLTPGDQVVTAITHVSSLQLLWTYMAFAAAQLLVTYVGKWTGGSNATNAG